MGFQLRIEDGSYVQTLEVRAGALTVGRNPPDGLALTSPGLSARHAIFRQKGDRVEVDALPTKIGVRLRGERVDHALLAVNEMIQVGWARITVAEITPEAAPAETPSAAAPSPPVSSAMAMAAAAATVAVATAAPVKLELEPEPPPPPVAHPFAPARAASQAAPHHAPAAHHRLHASEPAADFVVVSRQAVRVLPWWGISIALHALLLGVVLMLPKPPHSEDSDADSTVRITLRNTTRFEAEDVPVVEMSRRAVDMQRPDMAVPVDTPDSTLPVSPNPKGREGTGAPRAEDTGLVFDEPAGGSPWAQPGGSSSIGVGSGARFGSGVGSNLDENFGKDDAGRANAAAAGKLNGDPFTRSLVNGLRLRTTDRNVKVVSGDYDHGELVMTALGLGHGTLASDDLARNPPDQEIRAIFYNCTGRPASARTLENLERWVKDGGYLFTSDWGVENVVEKAFPGYVKSLRDGARLVMTPDSTITFTIAPGKHQLLAGLPPEAETSRWWLEDSSILFSIVKPEAVEVLAVSAELDRKYGSKFVAVTFPYGKGRVVHALGHMFQKEGNLRGAYAMQRLLLNFLYQAIRGGDTSASSAGGSGGRGSSDVTPPKLKLPADITAEATSDVGSTVSFTALAKDEVDGDVPVTCSPVSGSTFALGTTTVECSARDRAGNLATGSFTVTVRDTTAPSLALPSNVTTEATSAAGCTVTFTATARDAVSGNCTVICSPASGSTFAMGTTTVVCSTKDAAGNTATRSFNVTIRDTTAPTFSSLSVAPTSLESANHEMVRVTPKFSATDAVTASPSLVVVSITSNEEDDGLGNGDIAKDIDVRPNGDIYLRAEHSGSSGARIYTLTFKVADAAGNLSPSRTATVTVP